MDSLLARSALARFVSRAWTYPSAEVTATIGELLPTLSELFELAFGPHPHAPLIAEAQRAVRLAELESEYIRSFGHAVRSAHSLYETEFGKEGQNLLQSHEIAELGALYQASGLRRREDHPERDDHVALQAELLQVLLRREAYGQETGNEEQVESMASIRRLLLRDHLARFGIPLFRKLAKEGGSYGALAQVSAAFLELLCQAEGVEVGDDELMLRVPLLGPDEEVRCEAPVGPASGPSTNWEV
jgi:TorA maturation chaperone TorD